MPQQDMKNVLVVEDQESLRELLVFELELEGFHALEAENGQAALEIIEAGAIDCVVSDVRMPVLDGIGMVRALRERREASFHEVPVVVISAFSDYERSFVYASGVNAFLPKPYDQQVLVQSIRHCCLPKVDRWLCAPTISEDLSVLKGSFQQLSTEMQLNHVQLGTGGIFVPLKGKSYAAKDYVRVDLSFETGVLSELRCLARVLWQRGSDHDGCAAGLGLELCGVTRKDAELFVSLSESTTAYLPEGRLEGAQSLTA